MGIGQQPGVLVTDLNMELHESLERSGSRSFVPCISGQSLLGLSCLFLSLTTLLKSRSFSF